MIIDSGFLYLSDIIGVISFASSGFFVGVKKKLDLLGVFLSSFVTALGGGIVRDVIVGKAPTSLVDPFSPIIVTLVVFVLIIFKLYTHHEKFEQNSFFIVGDSIGLAAFSISGALVGIEAHFSVYGVIILSIVTAVGGGIIRDMMLNEIPFIMTQDFYASVSIIIAVLILFFNRFYEINLVILLGVFSFGLILRLFAYYRGWKLPSF